MNEVVIIKMAGAIVKTVSKNTICNVVATCWGELAESIEMLIPGIGDCAYIGNPTQKNVNRNNLRITNFLLLKFKTSFQLTGKNLAPSFFTSCILSFEYSICFI